MVFGLCARTFAAQEGLLPEATHLAWWGARVRLEHGLAAGGVSLLAGIGLILAAVGIWWRAGFGNLDYAHTMRWVIPGTLLAALGFQTILAAFLLSLLGLHRR